MTDWRTKLHGHVAAAADAWIVTREYSESGSNSQFQAVSVQTTTHQSKEHRGFAACLAKRSCRKAAAQAQGSGPTPVKRERFPRERPDIFLSERVRGPCQVGHTATGLSHLAPRLLRSLKCLCRLGFDTFQCHGFSQAESRHNPVRVSAAPSAEYQKDSVS
jgi:hypothetical protein